MYVDILLLAELTSGPKYGYEIKEKYSKSVRREF